MRWVFFFASVFLLCSLMLGDAFGLFCDGGLEMFERNEHNERV